MSDLVTLRHPKLPASQTIRIDRARIGARLAAGWEVVEQAAPELPESKPDVEPDKPKRRSRTNTPEEQ